MDILAPRSPPSRVDSPYPSASHTTTMASRLGPTFATALYFQRAVGSLSVFLCWRAYVLATFSLTTLLQTAKLLTFYAYVRMKFGAFHGYIMSTRIVAGVWDSKAVQMLRQKLFYEFALFILGMGNPLILMLFWPGWVVICGTAWAAWQFCI
ncbi:hypothetical protein VHEMI09729 [[Torrubiella] hemipterigena]|uniref:Uncharacterized protein n=1 Tax=[Torrubiella] hemipterigena TaxID=1531966 RepID=A0A0A1TAZ3_9HYPO|nr:hypothetical protein VHEMI09729 [[Torrubiella] hemipterigena]